MGIQPGFEGVQRGSRYDFRRQTVPFHTMNQGCSFAKKVGGALRVKSAQGRHVRGSQTPEFVNPYSEYHKSEKAFVCLVTY